MTTQHRLCVGLGVVVLSLGYGVLVVLDPEIASAIAAGYVAIVLTALILSNFWRKRV